jgi:type II secretion system protein D
MFRRSLAATLALCLPCSLCFAQNPAPLPGQERIERLQFSPQSDVKEMLALYERLTGYRLIYDNSVQGPVPLTINQELSADEAKRIIEIALLMNQFSLVPTEDPKVWKVFGIGRNPRQGGGVPIYSDPAMLPPTEQIVSYLFKLRYADPTELAQQLSLAFPASTQLGGQSMIALPKAGALLVTENTAIIRQIVRIIEELDTQPARVESRFFTLQRADAKDIQEKLTEILTKKEAAVPGGITPGTVAPRPQVARMETTPDGLPLPAGAPPGEAAVTYEINIGPTEENFVAGKVKITADVRTNRLHVIARPEAMREIAKLIEEFDENVPFGEPSVYPLKFVSANDVFQVLVKSVSDPGQEQQAGGATTPGGATQANRPAAGTLFGGGAGGNRFGDTGGFGGGSGSGSGSQTLSESLNAQERDIVPDAVTIGNTRIIADKRANSIIVVGNEDVKQKIFAVIRQLDIRAPQVMLHTCIGQLTLGNNEQFGVNYILNQGRDLENFAGGVTTGGGDGDGNGNGTTVGRGVVAVTGNTPVLNINNLLSQEQVSQIVTGGASGLSGFFTAGNAFNAIVTALETTNKFKVVSRPVLFTSNNKKAVIASGEEIAIPTNIQSGFSGGTNNNLVTNSSIQFKTVALTLEVLPLINADREVSMDIVQKIDEQSGTDVIDNNRIPRIATRVLQTNVSVPNGATLVLGGLIKNTYRKNTSGIPWISKVPLIGPLFRSTDSGKTREELVILIRPEVTVSPHESVLASEREGEFTQLEPDLEQTLIEPRMRMRAAPEELLRKPAPPELREYSGRPAYKRPAGPLK